MKQDTKTMNVAFLIYDQVEALDLNGPLDVFVKADAIHPNSYHCFTVGKTKEPIYMEANTMAVIPTYDIHTCPKPDMIVVPGANPEHITKYLEDKDFQETVLQWIKTHYDSGTVVFTICTGSMLLSGTGILENHDVTTHSMLLDTLEQYNPQANVIRNVRYVDQEQLITTARITAGIDAALYMVGKHHGQEIMDKVIHIFEYQNKKSES
ncbi:DJ-1/PfpI family protein [Chryseobacterium sp. CBTAP 102]|uniref:DJ-1/PfpI family protein n=1 Tax=Chryseobacterium sp. CBTAP 102 TaxID=2135644 RepID=UPI000D752C57|nr:DJ-1/PfpI family protein [Chryseobacterium sp. CBTAP 102]PXW09782.1 DJ-1/PfpI family protein [Chryseobacterium sp. CBTAP 102]